MALLSVIIPARNEEFLTHTVDDILKNIKGDTEIIIICDGYWPNPPIKADPRVNLVHHEVSIGQRAATNEGVNLSDSKYIMKCDAHCSFDKGFDVKLMADCEYDWTVTPTMYNLHVFDWECKICGERTYQGPLPSVCSERDGVETDCKGTEFEKVIVWTAKRNPRSEFYYFDKNLKFQYWRDFKKRPEAKHDIADTLGNLGACFFMHRERFLELGGLDEKHGSWGQLGTEVSCKSWLSGGRQVTNKKTWFSHLFRTQADFGFPYRHEDGARRHAKRYSKELWLGNKWPLAKHDLNWLIDKFAPVPDWHKEQKNQTKGFVYYTDNQCEERILKVVRDNLSAVRNGNKIVSVSHYPIEFGENIVMEMNRGHLTMFKQILAGLEAIDSDIVFMTEHDVVYHPSHFDFTPPKKDVFYYNENTWKVDAKSGQALFYYTKQTSGLCAYRELLLEHYRKRVERVEKEGFTRSMGFEPGTHSFPRGVDNYKAERYMSEHPNIDIRHSNNLTWSRFKKEQFRSERSIKGWVLADEVPFWGKTKDRFDDFLREI